MVGYECSEFVGLTSRDGTSGLLVEIFIVESTAVICGVGVSAIQYDGVEVLSINTDVSGICET